MTPTMFYAPTDLRWVDPRPTPAPSASDEDVVRELLESRLTGDELTRALQALGFLPYERALNVLAAPKPRARKKSSADTASTHCKNDHPRAVYGRVGSDNVWRCLLCERASKARQRARKKQAA